MKRILAYTLIIAVIASSIIVFPQLSESAHGVDNWSQLGNNRQGWHTWSASAPSKHVFWAGDGTTIFRFSDSTTTPASNGINEWTIIDIYAWDDDNAVILRTQGSLHEFQYAGGGLIMPHTSSLSLFGTSFFDLYGVSAQDIMIVGENGNILKYSSGSQSVQVGGQTTNYLRAIDGNDAFGGTVRIAVGAQGTIVRSADSGNTWALVSQSETTQDLFDVDFADANTVYIIGLGSSSLKSTDSGQTWTAINTIPAGLPSGTFRNVEFMDTNIGWVVGDLGTAIHTVDGGASWEIIPDTTFPSVGGSIVGLYDIAIADSSIAYFVGGHQTMMKLEVSPPDTDGDGVPDTLDLCADTPAGKLVDSTGCILNTPSEISLTLSPANPKPNEAFTITVTATDINGITNAPILIIENSLGTGTLLQTPTCAQDTGTPSTSYSCSWSMSGLIEDTYTWTAIAKDDLDLEATETGTFTIDYGLIAHWKFDEGIGTITKEYISGSEVSINSATWTLGAVGNALNFGGTSSINGADSLSAGEGISISSWVKFTGQRGIILSSIKSGATTPVNLLEYDQGLLYWYFPLGGSINSISAPVSIADNRWHHVAITQDYSSELNFYVDSILVQSTPAVSNGVSAYKLKIGIAPYGDYPFKGVIDEIRVYDRQLTEQEVIDIYNSENPILDSDDDGVADDIDNCPNVPNSDQLDTNADNIGDECQLAIWHFDNDYSAKFSGDSFNSVGVFGLGRIGQALKLNGDEVATINNNVRLTELDGSSKMTVETWVKLYPYDTTASVFAQLQSFGISVLGDSGNLELLVGTGKSNPTYEVVLAETNVADGTWHHIATTFDSGNINIYADGALIKSETISITQLISSNDAYAIDFYDRGGKIDELKVYNEVLSATQISEIYNNAPPEPIDSDSDEVADELDLCLNTLLGATVNIDGCSATQSDKTPPSILHTSVNIAPEGIPVTIVAKAVDEISSPLLTLTYKKVGDSTEQTVNMIFDEVLENYAYVIPAEEVTSSGLLYMLTAFDASGNTALWPESDSSGTLVFHTIQPDTDRDNIADEFDNCVHVANQDQEDFDQDNVGDACDIDGDGDGYCHAGVSDTLFFGAADGCINEVGSAIQGTDCNDLNSDIYPGRDLATLNPPLACTDQTDFNCNLVNDQEASEGVCTAGEGGTGEILHPLIPPIISDQTVPLYKGLTINSASATGGTAPYVYLFDANVEFDSDKNGNKGDDKDGSLIINSDDTVTITHTYGLTGTFTAKLTVKDGANDIKSTTFLVVVDAFIKPFTIQANKDEVIYDSSDVAGTDLTIISDILKIKAISTQDITADQQLTVELKVAATKPVSLLEAPAPEKDKLYKYLEITPPLEIETSVREATIDFKIDRTWFEINNADVNTVKLLRHSNDKWSDLETTRVQDTANHISYSAKSPGFSVFAITADSKKVVQKDPVSQTSGGGGGGSSGGGGLNTVSKSAKLESPLKQVTSAPKLGNGKCEVGETQQNACSDCGCSNGFSCVQNSCLSKAAVQQNSAAGQSNSAVSAKSGFIAGMLPPGGVILIVMILLIGIAAIYAHSHAGTSKLDQYVKKAKAKGYSDEKIRSMLRGVGWGTNSLKKEGL